MNALFDFTLYYIISFLIVLGVLIFCHELGHFLVAKICKVKVLNFALGFGPKIVWKQIGETEYSIRCLPLGGYVKMLGEDDEEEVQNLPPDEAARAFNHQPVHKRIAIAAAGSVFNLLLALLLFCGISLFMGDITYQLQVTSITPGSAAEGAGLQKDDIIVALQGKIIKDPDELQNLVKLKVGTPIEFTVLRGKTLLNIQVASRPEMEKIYGEDVKVGKIGIGYIYKIVNQSPLDPFTAFLRGSQKTWFWIEQTFEILGQLFTGKISIKMMGGPIMISRMTGDLAKQNLYTLIPFTAIISVNLGIINLFPIPVLDGGLILLMLFELFTGKQLNAQKRELAFKIGLFIIIALGLFITYHDIWRLIRH
jgi:regulator of sigma E protease